MENISDALSSEAAGTMAEAVRDADFAPWQLIFLILGGMLLWNLKGLYSLHVKKYETRRKYDHLDRQADDRNKMLQDKKEKRRLKAEKSARERKK